MNDLFTLGFCLTVSILFGPYAALGSSIAYLFVGGLMFNNWINGLVYFLLVFCAGSLSWKLWYSFFKQDKYEIPNLGSFNGFIKLFVMFIPFLLNALVLIVTIFKEISIDDIQFMLGFFVILISVVYFSNYFKLPFYTPKKQFKKRLPLKVYDFCLILSCILEILFLMSILNKYFTIPILILQFIFLLKPYNDKFFNIDETIQFNLIHKISFSVFLIFIILEIVFQILIAFESTGVENDMTLLSLLVFYNDSFFLLVFSFLIPVLIYVFFLEKNVINPINTISSALSKDLNNIRKDMALKYTLNKIPSNNELKKLANSLIQMEEDVIDYEDELIKVTSQKERYETELKLADTIQSSMISKDFVNFSSNQNFKIWGVMNPAREVGGDFYDYFKVDDENIGFVIGDVSGKGITASLIMVKAMTLIKDYLYYTKDPSKTFVEVNNLLCQGNVENLFVTCWLGKLNTKTGELTFVNAGHNPPLIKQNEDEFKYFVTDPDLVLACMEEMNFQSHSIQLNPGDSIFLYTDGVTEANNEYQGFYGEKRLKNKLNEYYCDDLEYIISSLEKDIDDFCSHKEQFDDTTMFILKYK